MRTVAFLNRKGGVGKTSTTHHLGGELARRGLRVLMVDADPQASLSQGLMDPRLVRSMAPSQTIAGIYQANAPLADLIVPAPSSSADLVPGSMWMDKVNLPDPWDMAGDQFLLRDSLEEVAGSYDWCLIDCPPNVQLCSWSALLAADGVIVPVQAEDYGAQGIVAVSRTIQQARTVNRRLSLLGYLITMFMKSLVVHVEYEADLRQIHGPMLFETIIPHAKDFKEAVIKRMPVCRYKPRSVAARAVQLLADETIRRDVEADQVGQEAA